MRSLHGAGAVEVTVARGMDQQVEDRLRRSVDPSLHGDDIRIAHRRRLSATADGRPETPKPPWLSHTLGMMEVFPGRMIRETRRKEAVKRKETGPDWLICQHCARGADPDDADSDNWLVSPHRNVPNLYIIRCPEHITEWSLRMTTGMTKANKEKMRWGTEVWPTLGPHREPGAPIPNFIGGDGQNHLKKQKDRLHENCNHMPRSD